MDRSTQALFSRWDHDIREERRAREQGMTGPGDPGRVKEFFAKRQKTVELADQPDDVSGSHLAKQWMCLQYIDERKELIIPLQLDPKKMLPLFAALDFKNQNQLLDLMGPKAADAFRSSLDPEWIKSQLLSQIGTFLSKRTSDEHNSSVVMNMFTLFGTGPEPERQQIRVQFANDPDLLAQFEELWRNEDLRLRTEERWDSPYQLMHESSRELLALYQQYCRDVLGLKQVPDVSAGNVARIANEVCQLRTNLRVPFLELLYSVLQSPAYSKIMKDRLWCLFKDRLFGCMQPEPCQDDVMIAEDSVEEIMKNWKCIWNNLSPTAVDVLSGTAFKHLRHLGFERSNLLLRHHIGQTINSAAGITPSPAFDFDQDRWKLDLSGTFDSDMEEDGFKSKALKSRIDKVLEKIAELRNWQDGTSRCVIFYVGPANESSFNSPDELKNALRFYTENGFTRFSVSLGRSNLYHPTVLTKAEVMEAFQRHLKTEYGDNAVYAAPGLAVYGIQCSIECKIHGVNLAREYLELGVPYQNPHEITLAFETAIAVETSNPDDKHKSMAIEKLWTTKLAPVQN